MIRTKFRGRLSHRELIERNNAADRYYASMAGVEPRAQTVLPPKRDRVRRPVDDRPVIPLEKEVLGEILKALRTHPRVGYVWRQTSGTFVEDDRYIQAGPKGMPDICGVLVGSGRFFAIEVKRPGQKADERQQERLDHFRRCGAAAGVAHGVDEALEIIK